MKERFKSYLEQHFKHIAPTEAAMEYRKSLLRQLLDREQELRIKGIEDDELIYNMIIAELGDLDEQLERFEKQQIKSGMLKRKVSAISIVSICAMALLTVVYLLVGLFAKVWHPTWLIMVGGVFVGVATMLTYVGIVKASKKRKFVVVRASVCAIEAMLCVFAFLILQLVVNLWGSWLIFLAMVILILGVDTAITFLVNSKMKWFELPVFVEVFGVLLYVILGIALEHNGVNGFWHPAWAMCLIGVVFALVEVVCFVVKRTHKANDEEKKKIVKKHVKVDESYWTQWDD